MKIKKITALEILDSRGNPTIETTITLENGMTVTASVPSGASVGLHEAVELRDGDKNRYDGKGVLKAIENVEKVIAPSLVGQESDVRLCDKIMRELDGTDNKAKLGANAILSVSIAVVRAQAMAAGKPLYLLLRELSGTDKAVLPAAMFNILNGGVHANNKICFQEFMIMPICEGAVCGERFDESLHMAVRVYHKLKNLLCEQGCSTGVGDEGGFAPMLKGSKRLPERQALDFLMEAVQAAGYEPGKEVLFCLDVAASEFYNHEEKVYELHGTKLKARELVDLYKELCDEYPIYSIEDGLAQDDWDGFKELTAELGNKLVLVGDDIFVSNPARIERGVEQGVCNAVLIKPNQIGSVTECLQAIQTAKANNYKTVISHRSGETCDTFIADLVVGTGAGLLKAGAPARGERVAKYDQLLRLLRRLRSEGSR